METKMLKRISRNLPAIGALLLIAAIVSGCTSGPKIRSDFDRDTDFSQYQTYNFYADAGPERTSYQSLFSQYMIAAVSKEMDARGYEKSDAPDLLINFNAFIRDKTKVTTSPAPLSYGGYYGYRRGHYDPWFGYSHSYATEVHVSEYTEGTVNIDLVDAKSKKLVWEAVAVGRVHDKTLQNLEQEVMDVVLRFFEAYPYRAGAALPNSGRR
jgi:Domain of unknown function (DUF4136)